MLCLLHDSRIISVDNFKRQHAELMKHHWIDSSILQTSDKQHPTTTGIFEVYGKKTGLKATELKELLIDWMCDKRTELSNCMAIALNQSKQTFTEWLQCITLNEEVNQFKYDDDKLYKKSDIRLVYIGHHMFAELKHIRQPKPQPTLTTPTTSPGTDKTRKRMSSGRRGKKVTNRGDKPQSKQSSKPTTPPLLPPPPTPRPSRRSR